MAENTGIEWAHHTFNPWIGCTKVSPGCDHCYAETLATNRLKVGWGPHAERRRTAPSTWRQPLAWNRRAEREGRRERVFCASLADVFDNQVPEQWREDLWELISATPHLDWLLLTKRPQNIAKMLPKPGLTLDAATWPWPSVWLGTTVENQEEADRRIPHLLAVPAAVRFLSCEPLLGPVDLLGIPWPANRPRFPETDDISDGRSALHIIGGTRIDWVIAGGESGPGARPMHPDWARSLRDQCAAAGVPFFFKQWGEWREFPTPEGSTTGVEADSEEAEAIYARAIKPGFITRSGSFIAELDDLPDDGTPCRLMERVGKKAAGRLLDGREHSEVPA